MQAHRLLLTATLVALSVSLVSGQTYARDYDEVRLAVDVPYEPSSTRRPMGN